MRLIDADALIEVLDKAGVLCDVVKHIIEDFPISEKQKSKDKCLTQAKKEASQAAVTTRDAQNNTQRKHTSARRRNQVFYDFCRDNNIVITTIDEGCRLLDVLKVPKGYGGGYVVRIPWEDRKDTFVFYDDNKPEWVQYYVIAHELGHLITGQFDRDNPSTHEERKANFNLDELEANMFAAVVTGIRFCKEYGII